MDMTWIKFGKFVDVKPDFMNFRRLSFNVEVPDHRRFRDWLNTNVGREGQEWMQQSKRNNGGFVAYRYRFKNDDDAVMFKLIFTESLHV